VVVPTQPEAAIEPHVVLLPTHYYCLFFDFFQHCFFSQDKEQLEAFFSTIPMSFLNPPRLGKKLLVLDLDHTLLDFTRKEVAPAPPAPTPALRNRFN
jgi:hypothetical protein